MVPVEDLAYTTGARLPAGDWNTVAGLVLAGSLGTWNVLRTGNPGVSTLEAALSLPAVTFESAYEMEALSVMESFVTPSPGTSGSGDSLGGGTGS